MSAQGLKSSIEMPADDVGASPLHAALRSLRNELTDVQSQLHATEQRWDLLLLSAEQGIWDWVPGSDPMTWSPRFTRMLGYADGDLAPSVTSFKGLIHPEDADAAWGAVEAHAAGKTPLCEAEFRMRSKDGSWRWIHCRAKAGVDENGVAVRMVGVNADVTSQKQPQAEGAVVAARQSKPAPHGGSLDLPVAKTHCSNCHSDLLVRSRWRLWERPLMFLLVQPVRCRSCGRRGFKPLWAGVPRPPRTYRRTSASPSDS